MSTLSPRTEDRFRIPGVDQWASRVGLGGAATGGHGWGARDDDAAVAAIRAAAEAGITFFDTADVYGLGLAERLLRLGLDQIPGALERSVIATKGGVRWDDHGRTVRDSSPTHLAAAAEASLRRLGVECIPLYYLHWQDGKTPLEDSIGALVRLREQGKVRAVGVSNVLPAELRVLASARIAAVQVKGNLLEPDEAFAVAEAAQAIGAVVICSSALADGLLSGAIGLGRVFDQDDHRRRYPLFQPGAFEEALRRVEIARGHADALGRSVAQVALRWLLDCGSADAVLCGAKRPEQLTDNAGALGWSLPPDRLHALARGVPMSTGSAFKRWREADTRRARRPAS
ncbi:MAG: aldo/keto reductase [Acidobacteria bacterium]|nr:aldo/keto reductase [Acidobacteriota bacterium]